MKFRRLGEVWRPQLARGTGGGAPHPEEKERSRNATGNCEVVQRGEGVRLYRPEDGSADVFVHYTEIQGTGFRTLEENQKVEFEIGHSPKGPQATGVRSL